jgi:hypothetical protein
MTQKICRFFVASLLFGTVFASAQRAPLPQQLTFTPYHSSGIYNIGQTVGWTVTPGPVTPTYAYKYTVRRNNSVVLKEGKLNLSAGKDTIEITGDQPEMIYVAIEPYAMLPSAALAADPAAADATTPSVPRIPADAVAPSVTAAAAGILPTRSPISEATPGATMASMPSEPR